MPKAIRATKTLRQILLSIPDDVTFIVDGAKELGPGIEWAQELVHIGALDLLDHTPYYESTVTPGLWKMDLKHAPASVPDNGDGWRTISIPQNPS